jgi:feruloyl esterase
MPMSRRLARLCLATAALLAPAAAPGIALAAAPACDGLAALKLADTVLKATAVSGPFSAPVSPFDFNQAPVQTAKPFCRVEGTIAPAIRFELWLPPAESWNGMLQGIGNGGMAGFLSYAPLAASLAAGYAAVTTDLGHQGGGIDGSFAIGNPQAVIDWGHRATHEMTVKAKQIVAAHYGKPQERAYFTGCSGGGRQALMQAQRYPGDYDGILAGDPTADFTHLTTGGRLWQMHATQGAGYIPASKVPTIANAVVAACDAIDGVKDGVLEDPRQCKFDPATIQCRAGDADSCLTQPQVAALKRIYAGAKNSKGEAIFPGTSPGGELGPGGWSSYITGAGPGKGSQLAYASGYLRGLVFENPEYDAMSFDWDRDVPVMDAKLASIINATNPDLAAFKARGGKLIQYHGWNDPGVAPMSSVNYYESVQRKMGGAAGVRDFYRLFMVPGMQHCAGGPGPDKFDGLAALRQWVEQGKAPERIVAAHLSDGRTDRTRPLCPYPQKAKWNGKGSSDEAASFSCE